MFDHEALKLIYDRLTSLERTLGELVQRSSKMDAQVLALQANIVTLAQDVQAVLTLLQGVQAQLAAGIDAGDEAAITAANASLVSINAQLAAVVVPATVGPTGTTGTTGTVGQSGLTAATGPASGTSGNTGP
jgi:hypothetical protein